MSKNPSTPNKLNDLAQKSVLSQQTFLQHTLLVSSSTFGILVSLHSQAPLCQCIRWVFVLAVGILALGILTNSISLYYQTKVLDRFYRDTLVEYEAAELASRSMGLVFVTKSSLHAFCEPATYILLLSALLLLATYFVGSLIVS